MAQIAQTNTESVLTKSGGDIASESRVVELGGKNEMYNSASDDDSDELTDSDTEVSGADKQLLQWAGRLELESTELRHKALEITEEIRKAFRNNPQLEELTKVATSLKVSTSALARNVDNLGKNTSENSMVQQIQSQVVQEVQEQHLQTNKTIEAVGEQLFVMNKQLESFLQVMQLIADRVHTLDRPDPNGFQDSFSAHLHELEVRLQELGNKHNNDTQILKSQVAELANYHEESIEKIVNKIDNIARSSVVDQIPRLEAKFLAFEQQNNDQIANILTRLDQIYQHHQLPLSPRNKQSHEISFQSLDGTTVSHEEDAMESKVIEKEDARATRAINRRGKARTNGVNKPVPNWRSSTNNVTSTPTRQRRANKQARTIIPWDEIDCSMYDSEI